MKATDRLQQQFKRLDGALFKASLTNTPKGGQHENSSYRILFTNKPCFVKVGDVVKTPGGEKLILLQHPSDASEVASFKAAYVSKEETWFRTPKVLDTVSKVMKDGTPVSMGILYVNFDMPHDVPVGVLSDTRYRFITGQDVKVGDKIGTLIVKTLYNVSGVKLGFAE